MSNNTWTDNESDDDYNEEIIQNEEPPPGIDPEFIKSVLKLKKNIYKAIVIEPELGTKKAQNTGVLGDYIKALNNVNNLSKQAQRGTIDKSKLNQFPEETQEPIYNLLTIIADHSKNNPPAVTIPYVDYIQNSFKEHPFVLKKSFNQE